MADNKCNDHWYKSKEDLDKNGDCPYNHDENGNPVENKALDSVENKLDAFFAEAFRENLL